MQVFSTAFLVDDDDFMLEYIGTLLKSDRRDVRQYNSAESFLNFYRPEMHGCLILDVNMPGLSGLELQKILLERDIHIPIIFISGTPNVSMAIDAFKTGAFDFIEKENINSELPGAVHKAIQKDKSMRENEAKKLQSALEFYAQNIVETVRQPLFLLDDSLKLVLANQNAYEMFGVERDDNTENQFSLFQNLLWQIPQMKSSLEKVIVSNTEIRDLEVKVNFPGIGLKTILLNAAKLKVKKGSINRILLSIEDITHRKLVENALFHEKEQALVTLNSIGEAVITTSTYGIVEYMNPIAEKLTGWKQQEAIDKPIDLVMNLVHSEDESKPVNPLRQCLNQKETITIDHNIELINKNQDRASIELVASLKHNAKRHITGVVVVFKDVTEQRKMEHKLEHQATHDALTGLVNRLEFEKRLDHTCQSSQMYGSLHMLCYLDLDQFKIVNDTAGHKAGDELLKQISSVIRDSIRSRDTLARIGGDEFGLILENCPMDQARRVVDELINAVCAYRFVWEGEIFSIGLSVGMVAIAKSIVPTEQLLSRADVACYTAKELGRNRSHLYQEDSGEPARRYSELLRAAGLTKAIEEKKFQLYCQPIYAIKNSQPYIINYEILVRLMDDKGTLLLPGAFIPAAERYGIMEKIDRWVIHNTFQEFSEKQSSFNDIKLAINLSGNSLSDDNLLYFVDQQLSEFEIDPTKICFEITETSAIHNIGQAKSFIHALKEKGCRFALDDFGSGLSSFSYLQSLPVDYLKIDGSFVRDIVTNPIDHAMVVAINEIGHTMGLGIIAEYAESKEVILALQKIGVDFAQGFALQKPVPLHSIFIRKAA